MKYQCDGIVDDEVAEKYFDCCVNVGGRTAVLIVQRALQSVGKAVTHDGLIGTLTLSAINTANSQCLLAAMRSEQAAHYRLIMARKPSLEKYKNGWLRRAYS